LLRKLPQPDGGDRSSKKLTARLDESMVSHVFLSTSRAARGSRIDNLSPRRGYRETGYEIGNSADILPRRSLESCFCLLPGYGLDVAEIVIYNDDCDGSEPRLSVPLAPCIEYFLIVHCLIIRFYINSAKTRADMSKQLSTTPTQQA
jgi:hypothetical protein